MQQDAIFPSDTDAQIAGLKAQIDARDRVIAMLRAQLAQLRRMTFGTSSEKLAREIEQLELALEEYGQLVELAAERGRATRPDIKLGICGEHGGDPASIAFCEKVGLDYVSASPYRVPIARLAAAQAALCP